MRITLENLYDKYSGMLYSIALEISPSAKDAEFILINTFQKVDSENLLTRNSTAWCIALIKGLVETAQEKFNSGQKRNNFVLKRFENTPLLHTLFSQQRGITDYCKTNRISITEARRQLREELATLEALEV